ncbi:hypothetical protein CASFOL_013542 [Castilleja foliolosa]|uniref:Peptidase A1 domain-containing protein n=1 Tax=Castilleja foliolosa TaxID=1961234 RepID=A0ABD3DM40_9LAMI
MCVLLLLLFSLVFSWSDFSLVSSANSSITLPLSRVTPPPSTTTGNNPKYPNTRIPLYPDGRGYFVELSFGKPPQTLRLNMDTGSSLVWFPCTHDNYTGTHGNISKADPTFIPENSSSYKEVTFNSPECGWLFGPDRKGKNPTGPCPYTIIYGLGNTTGLLVSESLTIPGLSVANFIAGCSIASDQMREGMVGFGRSPLSLPSQLGLKAFSHCMVPHDLYDNTTASSDLVLMTTWDGAKRPSGKIQYTPFVSNPTAYELLETCGPILISTQTKNLTLIITHFT